MTVSIAVSSRSDQVLGLVRDFAHGMGCPVNTGPVSSGHIRIEIDDSDHSLVELLTHVALCTAKAGIEVSEPHCEIRYRHRGVASDVTLALRLEEFDISTATAGV